MQLFHLLQKTLLWISWSSWADSPPDRRPMSVLTSEFNSPKCLLSAGTVLVDWWTTRNVGAAALCFKGASLLSTLVWLVNVFNGARAAKLVPRLTLTVRSMATSSDTFTGPRLSTSAAAAAAVCLLWSTLTSSRVSSTLWFSLQKPKVVLILELTLNLSQRDFASEESSRDIELTGFRTLRCFVGAGRPHRCSPSYIR